MTMKKTTCFSNLNKTWNDTGSYKDVKIKCSQCRGKPPNWNNLRSELVSQLEELFQLIVAT